MKTAFRVGVRDGFLMGVGIWLGLMTAATGHDAYHRGRRALRNRR